MRMTSPQGNPSRTKMPSSTSAGSTPDWVRISKKPVPASRLEKTCSPDLKVTCNSVPSTTIFFTSPLFTFSITWEIGISCGWVRGVKKDQATNATKIRRKIA